MAQVKGHLRGKLIIPFIKLQKKQKHGDVSVPVFCLFLQKMNLTFQKCSRMRIGFISHLQSRTVTFHGLVSGAFLGKRKEVDYLFKKNPQL